MLDTVRGKLPHWEDTDDKEPISRRAPTYEYSKGLLGLITRMAASRSLSLIAALFVITPFAYYVGFNLLGLHINGAPWTELKGYLWGVSSMVVLFLFFGIPMVVANIRRHTFQVSRKRQPVRE